jgi:hypothetical protein
MAASTKKLLPVLLPPALCLLLLAGLVAQARTRVQPADAEPFHQRAAAAIAGIPANFDNGQWVSEEEPEPPTATALLRPNAILSRRYIKHLPDGQILSVGVLIVQCRDARDMQGHYPPRCYPANGAKQLESIPRRWSIAGTTIPGMEYLFTQLTEGRNQDLRVYNFFVIPEIPGLEARAVSGPNGGRGICPDIDSVYASGEDYQQRYYGAAQFQFVFPDELSQAIRDEILAEFLAPNLNVVTTLMNNTHE